MEAFIRTYSPSDVTLYVNGFRVTGWENITVKPGTARFTMIRGARGRTTRAKQLDTSAILTVELDQTSQANTVFSQILQNDLKGSINPLHVVLKDGFGGTTVDSLQAYISGYPEIHYRAEGTTRTWELAMLSTQAMDLSGGGSLRQSLLQGAVNIVGNLIGGE